MLYLLYLLLETHTNSFPRSTRFLRFTLSDFKIWKICAFKLQTEIMHQFSIICLNISQYIYEFLPCSKFYEIFSNFTKVSCESGKFFNEHVCHVSIKIIVLFSIGIFLFRANRYCGFRWIIRPVCFSIIFHHHIWQLFLVFIRFHHWNI